MTRFKVSLFESLEWLNETCRAQSAQDSKILHRGKVTKYHQGGKRYLWVYVSTIGELNAISNLLDHLLEYYVESQLVLLTDHPHYLEIYAKRYPEAVIINHGDTGKRIHKKIQKYPPFFFLIAEIPLTLFDAPCRLSFKVLYYAKLAGASIIAVNGWFYNENPTCTMDSIEKQLFDRNYLEIIDLYLIQQEIDTQKLITLGVKSEKIHVTGNLKFDNLASSSQPPLNRTEIIASNRPVMVSGCVTNISEQELILETFQKLKEKTPDLLLIMAPRHPENSDRMNILESMLTESGWKHCLRTEQTQPVDHEMDILILNTIGELSSFYSLGDICYVGLNHNLLEPLSFLKPIFVTPGWDERYPSFPVYSALKEKSLIHECKASSSEELSDTINEILNIEIKPDFCRSQEALSTLSGSLEKSKSIIFNLVKTKP